MIRIKKVLQESDIPIPQQVSNELMVRLKLHILNYLLGGLDNYIIELKKDYEHYKQEIASVNPDAIALYNDAFMKSYDQKIFSARILYKEINKLLPEHRQIELTSILKAYYTGITFSNYISSSYKYVVLPGMANDDLALEVYFDTHNPHDKHSLNGEYQNRGKIIRLFSPIWYKFLKWTHTAFSMWEHQNIINWDYLLNIKQTTLGFIDRLFTEYQSTLEHELTHFIQYTFIPKGDWSKNYIQPDQDFDKYMSQNTEFFPKLKGEYVNFKKIFPNNNFSNKSFEDYISYSDFFTTLKDINLDKYKKAIVQFWAMLRNKTIEESIKDLSMKKNNNSILNNILIETIVHNTTKQIKERIVNPHNVKDWNLEQVKIIQDLIKLNKFNLSDTNLIIRFGRLFHDYVVSHQYNAPDTNDMIKALGL